MKHIHVVSKIIFISIIATNASVAMMNGYQMLAITHVLGLFLLHALDEYLTYTIR